MDVITHCTYIMFMYVCLFVFFFVLFFFFFLTVLHIIIGLIQGISHYIWIFFLYTIIHNGSVSSANENHCPNAINVCLLVNLNSLMFIRANLVGIWMHFTCIFNLNALFTRPCEKIMKSHANEIKLNELLTFLNLDLGDHSNSL